ncbi:MAG TPA: glycine cleavage T C-terminal barrel domain-containing protein [Pyrinomonadaceae bacterium]|nr:glycine cleavage T C-terminal barrel domain-containing protein [Pyrinomonadaceae bacterium]
MIEYEAVRGGGAGLIDLSASHGRIRVSGSEATMFLNGLLTNDIKNATENSWLPAVFPTVQGRVIGAVRILREDEGFLFDTEIPSHDAVLKTISRFTLAGDFKVSDVSNEMAMLTVQGQRAGEVIKDVNARIVRATHTGEDGFDLLINTDQREALIEQLIAAGAQPVSADVFEMLRIEAGIPRHGQDMDETNVVLEANLDDAISYTKGCYVGQEIIIRIKHRGHVAKKLTGITFHEPVEPGETITSADGKEIGRVTSASYSPELESPIALGYVRYEYLAPGTTVKVDDVLGTVVELPFVRGGWHE